MGEKNSNRDVDLMAVPEAHEVPIEGRNVKPLSSLTSGEQFLKARRSD
jgi:hypothetical protein